MPLSATDQQYTSIEAIRWASIEAQIRRRELVEEIDSFLRRYEEQLSRHATAPLPRAARNAAWAVRPVVAVGRVQIRALHTVLRRSAPCFPMAVSRGAHLTQL